MSCYLLFFLLIFLNKNSNSFPNTFSTLLNNNYGMKLRVAGDITNTRRCDQNDIYNLHMIYIYIKNI